MGAENTVLEGCEVLCLTGDLIACPLSSGERKACREALQYQAGMKEIVKWNKEQYCIHNEEVERINCEHCLQEKLREGGEQ